jgi:hypothetical protein
MTTAAPAQTDLRAVARRLTGALQRLERLDRERGAVVKTVSRLWLILAQAYPPDGDLERYTALAGDLATAEGAPYIVVRPHPKAVSGDSTGWYVVAEAHASDEDRTHQAARVEA